MNQKLTDQQQEWIHLAHALFAQRGDKTWIPYVRHVMPRLIPAAFLNELEDDGVPRRICAHAQTAILKLAAGHMNYITPRGQGWFSFEPSLKGRSARDVTADEKDWYANATRRVRNEIERSNFYTSEISMVIDRCATGTGLMMVKECDGNLLFTHVPAGTYAVAENEKHEVDTVVRKFNYTAHQAASAWGEGALSKSMLCALKNEKERFTKQFEIWHMSVPRKNYLRKTNAVAPTERQWADVYIEPGENVILFEGGDYEFPFVCSRFIKYGNQVYGQSVLAGIMDTIHDSIIMNTAMKTAAQRTAIPSVLIAGSQAGEIDLRGGGMTVVRPEEIGMKLPQAWALAGEYTVGKDLLEMYNNEIDEATFVSVLQNITQVDRQMTATEVNARESERMMTFSQSFTQFVSDFQPFMERIFNCCFRMGVLPPDAPFDVYEATVSGNMKLKKPEVSYMGIMAKALKRAEYTGLVNALQMAMQFAQSLQTPEPLDAFRVSECVRTVVDEEMVPEKCLRSAKETAQRTQEREQQQAMMMAMQQAQMQATANRDNAQAEAFQQQ
ncbi:MAG: portal protein [Akkermansiaceae bacterium]|nr:portal protein [Akkermansiaceae bacterium]